MAVAIIGLALTIAIDCSVTLLANKLVAGFGFVNSVGHRFGLFTHSAARRPLGLSTPPRCRLLLLLYYFRCQSRRATTPDVAPLV